MPDPLVNPDGQLTFPGWWDDGDKADCPEPWECWAIYLFGMEAGDYLDDWEHIKARLADADLKLVRISTGEDAA